MAMTKQEKADKKAERAEINQLKDTQKFEARALKEELKVAGTDKTQSAGLINAEKAANAEELTKAKGFLSTPGRQTLISETTDGTRTQASTYDATTGAGKSANDRLDAALGLQDKYNISGVAHPDSRTTTGISVGRLDKALNAYGESGNYGETGPVAKSLNRLDAWGKISEGGGYLTEQDIARNGKINSIKPVKGTEDVFRVVIGDNSGASKNFTTQYFRKDANGYIPVALDRYAYDAPDKSGLGLAGNLIGMALTFWNPLALGTFGAGVLGGAVGGGLATGSIEGALKGGIAGGVGGFAGDAASGFVSGVQDATLAKAITQGISGAASGATSTLLNGGDFSDIVKNSAISGIASGAGSYVGGTVKGIVPKDYGNTVGNAAGGAVTGLINAVGRGGDIGRGVLIGAGAGAVTGAAQDILNTGTDASRFISGATGVILDSALPREEENDANVQKGNGTVTQPVQEQNTFAPASINVPGAIQFRDLRTTRNTDWMGRRF